MSSNDDLSTFLAREAVGDDGIYEDQPDHSPAVKADENWYPRLNPSQFEVFEDDAERILCEGPRGSGKGIGALHRLVRHCYENKNAVAQIIGVGAAALKGGMWDDLVNLVLPTWKYGNRKPDPETGEPSELIDNGIDIEYTEPKPDAQTKRLTLWIGNIHGGWSMVQMISVPHVFQIEGRTKGPKPSFIILEEATDMESQKYFTVNNNQLGRNVRVKGSSQLIAVCNPKGPSHWVYKLWYETHKHNPRFKVFKIPFEENRANLPPGYIENVKDGLRDDPIKYQRDVEGKWVEYPEGDAIFAAYFKPRIHIKGDAIEGTGLLPIPGYPITIGYDTGTKNTGVSFEQRIPVKNKKHMVLIFDEIFNVGQFKPLEYIMPEVIDKLDFWCRWVKHPFYVDNISDRAAFDIQNTDGTYDSLEIERLSQELLESEKYPALNHLSSFIVEPAPKGNGSVEARVRMIIQMLVGNHIACSATCPAHTNMFRLLRSKKEGHGEYKANLPFQPEKTESGEIHIFDSMSYPLYYYQMGGVSRAKAKKSSFIDL